MSRPATTIPARRGKAARVSRGQTVRVVNTHGEQVVDTWAFNAARHRASSCRWSTAAPACCTSSRMSATRC